MNPATLAQIRAIARVHTEAPKPFSTEGAAGLPPEKREGQTDADFRAARRRWARPFRRYVCPDCDKVYKDEYDAGQCCPRDIGMIYVDESTGKEYCSPEDLAAACKAGGAGGTDIATVPACTCPVCGEASSSPHESVECCLWKDLDAPTRWKVAAALEAGSTWTEQLAALEGGAA